jgi:hypothetical protein
MGGSALLHTVTFAAVLVMILLTVWIVLMLESGGRAPRTREGPAEPIDHPGQGTAPEHKDA